MGKVQQQAGGGKVTVTGLTAEVVKTGTTVTVKQGSKVVQSVTGTLALKRVFVANVPVDVSKEAFTVDVKNILPNYKNLSAEDFTVTDFSIYCKSGSTTTSHLTGTIAPTYNSVTGVLSFDKNYVAIGTLLRWGYNVYYYV